LDNPSARVNLSLPVLERLRDVIVDECNRARRMYEAYSHQLQLEIYDDEMSHQARTLKARYEHDISLWEDAYLEIAGAIIDIKNNRERANDMWIEV